MSINVKRVDHVGLITKDLEESVRFYTEVFDMKILSKENLEHLGLKNAILNPGGDTNIEIVQFIDGRNYNYLDGYVEFISLAVDDIFATIDTLTAEGYPMIQPEPVQIGPNEYFTFLRGPGGEKIEIVQK